jgi:hypothetical protein
MDGPDGLCKAGVGGSSPRRHQPERAVEQRHDSSEVTTSSAASPGHTARHPRRLRLIPHGGEIRDRRRSRLLQNERHPRGDQPTTYTRHRGVHPEHVNKIRLRPQAFVHAEDPIVRPSTKTASSRSLSMMAKEHPSLLNRGRLALLITQAWSLDGQGDLARDQVEPLGGGEQ